MKTGYYWIQYGDYDTWGIAFYSEHHRAFYYPNTDKRFTERIHWSQYIDFPKEKMPKRYKRAIKSNTFSQWMREQIATTNEKGQSND